MMFLSKRNLLVLLGLLVVGATATPTASPSSAPTSAGDDDSTPTPAPPTNPGPTPAPPTPTNPTPAPPTPTNPTPAPPTPTNPTPAPPTPAPNVSSTDDDGPDAGPAPTSSPTSSLDPEPEPEPTTTARAGGNGGNQPGPKPTRAPGTTVAANVSAPADAPTISFETKLTVQSATDFSTTAFLASVAESSGVPAGNVVVKSVDFVVAVSYSFAEDVTEAEVKAGAAAGFGVEESMVEVTLTAARRLVEVNGRRLAVTAEVKVTTPDAAVADQVSTKMATPADITAGISTATGKTVAPTVATAPVMDVIVVTEVTSTDSTVPTAPTGAQLKTKMEAKTGATFTVTVSEPQVVTTAAVAESSGACTYKAFSAVLAMVLSSLYFN